jgi:hypothetical protein
MNNWLPVRGKANVEMSHGASTVRYNGGSLWISGPSVRRITPAE